MVWTKMHTQSPSIIRPDLFLVFFNQLFPLSLPEHASLCNWLYTLVSWSRPKQCYSSIPSVTALQAHKYKDTLFGALPCLIPIILPSHVSLQTHAVLPVNKYSLSFRIINTVLVKSLSLKDKIELLFERMLIQNTQLHCLEDFPSSFVYLVFFYPSAFFWLQR